MRCSKCKKNNHMQKKSVLQQKIGSKHTDTPTHKRETSGTVRERESESESSDTTKSNNWKSDLKQRSNCEAATPGYGGKLQVRACRWQTLGVTVTAPTLRQHVRHVASGKWRKCIRKTTDATAITMRIELTTKRTAKTITTTTTLYTIKCKIFVVANAFASHVTAMFYLLQRHTMVLRCSALRGAAINFVAFGIWCRSHHSKLTTKPNVAVASRSWMRPTKYNNNNTCTNMRYHVAGSVLPECCCVTRRPIAPASLAYAINNVNSIQPTMRHSMQISKNSSALDILLYL